MTTIFLQVIKRNKISKVKDNEGSTVHTISGSDESNVWQNEYKIYKSYLTHI